jgi:hypothetical protein
VVQMCRVFYENPPKHRMSTVWHISSGVIVVLVIQITFVEYRIWTVDFSSVSRKRLDLAVIVVGTISVNTPPNWKSRSKNSTMYIYIYNMLIVNPIFHVPEAT